LRAPFRIPNSDPLDKELFFCSTIIQVGDGKTTPFKKAKWLQGVALKDITPNLFKRTRFKNRSVHIELHNYNWTRNIHEIDSPTLLEEYVTLFLVLSTVSLNSDKDEIFWKWTPNGKYTVASAYEIQFIGAMTFFPVMDIWRRCKIFTWPVMHDRILTMNNMTRKNWSCNPICSLDFCQLEIAGHLLTGCNYTEALWSLTADRYDLPSYDYLISKGGLVD
jgi:hypothetical protein